MFFLPWLEVLGEVRGDSGDLDGTVILLGVRPGELEAGFPQLLTLAPVFISRFRGRRKPLTATLFLVLVSWPFLVGELFLS